MGVPSDLTGASSAAARNATVCLVDDDPSVLKATERLISSAGWQVESFADPVAFLRYAEVHQPKVAVLDVRMFPIDGLDVQIQLRTLSPTTRVIILTSKDDPSIRTTAVGAGASAFFLKPAGRQEFLASVRSAFAEG
jgi:FixJ family two-component response regulator